MLSAKKFNSKGRKIWTLHGILNLKSDVDKTYIARKGGRQLMEIEGVYKVVIVSVNYYLENLRTFVKLYDYA